MQVDFQFENVICSPHKSMNDNTSVPESDSSVENVGFGIF